MSTPSFQVNVNQKRSLDVYDVSSQCTSRTSASCPPGLSSHKREEKNVSSLNLHSVSRVRPNQPKKHPLDATPTPASTRASATIDCVHFPPSTRRHPLDLVYFAPSTRPSHGVAHSTSSTPTVEVNKRNKNRSHPSTKSVKSITSDQNQSKSTKIDKIDVISSKTDQIDPLLDKKIDY